MKYEDVYVASGIPKEKIYKYQKLVATKTFKGSLPLLINIPTAGGKTLAVLAPTLALDKTMIFTEPTISLTEDLELRIGKILTRLSESVKEPLSYIIDTGERKEKIIFYPSGKRERILTHTYDSNIVLTTYDEFVYRMLGYGDWRWAYLFPQRIEKNCHVCFDECHSLDSVGFTLFYRVISKLEEMKVGTYVMSATMPPELRKTLIDKLKMEFIDERPNIATSPKKTLEKSLQYLPNINITGENRREAFLGIKGIIENLNPNERKVIVVLTYISDAFEVYRWALNQLYENCFFYHGRLLRGTKRFRYRKLKWLDEESKGYLLVTTHAIKEGCDLNADVMLIEITDPFSLIQLLGRVRRFADVTPGKAIIVGNMDTFSKKCEKAMITILEEYEKLLKNFLHERVIMENDITKLKSMIKEAPEIDSRLDARLNNILNFVYRKDIDYIDAWIEGIPYTREAAPSIDVFFVHDTKRLNFPDETEEEPLPQRYLHLKTSFDIFESKEHSQNVDFLLMIYDNGLWKKLSPIENIYPTLKRKSLYSRRVYLFLSRRHLISRGLVFPPKIFNFRKIDSKISVRINNIEIGHYTIIKKSN